MTWRNAILREHSSYVRSDNLRAFRRSARQEDADLSSVKPARLIGNPQSPSQDFSQLGHGVAASSPVGAEHEDRETIAVPVRTGSLALQEQSKLVGRQQFARGRRPGAAGRFLNSQNKSCEKHGISMP
jgi:hypothetical protein